MPANAKRKRRVREEDQDDFDEDRVIGALDDVDDKSSEAEEQVDERDDEPTHLKKLRLAKEYLNKISQDQAFETGDIDAKDIDEEIIEQRVRHDLVNQGKSR